MKSSLVDSRWFVVNRRCLVLAGLCLLLVWLLRPFIATVVYNNLGSVRLNRALLAPDLTAEERLDGAVAAGGDFQAALAWDPLNGQAHYNLATLYDFWGDRPSAARAWSRAAALNAHDPSSRFAFGQVLAELGVMGMALREWQAADAALYFVNQGLFLTSAGDHARALEQYQRSLAITPDLVEGYYHLGRALMALGEREQSLAALEQAAVLEPPSSPRRYLLQAEVYTAREEWTAALAAYRRAIDLTPDDPVPHYRIAWVLDQKLGEKQTAIAHYERALQLNRDYVPPRLTLAALYEERGDCDAVARWLDPFLALAGEPDARGDVAIRQAERTHRRLGICLLDQGRWDEALFHLQGALALTPRSIDAHFDLAKAYVQARRYHEAIDVYLQIREFLPDNAQAQQALEELGWLSSTDEAP